MGLWEDEIRKLVGKRIDGIVVAKHDRTPKNQVFLIFNDGTYYELYGDEINGCKSIDQGGSKEVRSYLKGRPGIDILLDTHDLAE
jgi:hypothetical protein